MTIFPKKNPKKNDALSQLHGWRLCRGHLADPSFSLGSRKNSESVEEFSFGQIIEFGRVQNVI